MHQNHRTVAILTENLRCLALYMRQNSFLDLLNIHCVPWKKQTLSTLKILQQNLCRFNATLTTFCDFAIQASYHIPTENSAKQRSEHSQNIMGHYRPMTCSKGLLICMSPLLPKYPWYMGHKDKAKVNTQQSCSKASCIQHLMWPGKVGRPLTTFFHQNGQRWTKI